ncbi:conserved hypothetical protein [Talaromyces stipitatus ATCC 10500]|uniref:Uncharacterized protein n=1 Tax=Talaromyces stipitatus (strain ATCC 10500 / CBS 375.48 / QM 6759 / NRRL 1006) TaxID=441959 RepID=B8M2T4_TALSN|nr:uncharacterized protein TSTA_094350 [Talaromyces stipitatus ATCC 10500]EED22189.1 conserved hypothetical protein [Talaromyces stipitatus ATCC 10500]
MESPSPSKHHLSPTKTPLFPTSPERINQQKLAGSFSVPSDLSQKSSDVREKIAFLNNLSQAGSPAASPQHVSSSTASSGSAALQRAILGREEAESALANANNLLSEAQARERRISERLESLLEELQTTRERQAHERTVFEKEVRKARKEAFRAGSMLVKIQEELKLSKGEIKTLKEEVRAERESKETAKQEAFERAYALAGMSEELQSVKDQLRAMESNNQQSVLESHVDEVEGSINKPIVDYVDQATCTTPTARRPKRSADALEILQVAHSDTEHEAHRDETPNKKMRLSRRASDKGNIQPGTLEDQGDLIADLQTEIKLEKRRREKAEDMVLFMKMECQFKRCSCRIAESLGQKYVHDKEWDDAMREEDLQENMHDDEHVQEEEEQEQNTREETPATSAAHSPLVSPVTAMTPPTPHYQETTEAQKARRPARQSSVAFCEETGTFVQVSSPHAYMQDRPSEEPLVLPNADEDEGDDIDVEVEDDTAVPRVSPAVRVMQMQTQTEDIITHRRSYEIDIEAEEQQVVNGPPHRTVNPLVKNTEIVTSIARNPILPPQRSSERQPITPVDQIIAVKEETITRTVPIQLESRHTHNPMDVIPGTPLTREEALAQIRARRGRTKSGTQRSVSANEATARSGPGGMKVAPARRIPGVKHSDIRSESDVKDRRDTAPVGSRRY